MSKETKKEEKRDVFFGCYGPKMKTSEVQNFVKTAIQDNWDRDNHRFTINVWGLPGCVCEDTVIKVKKVSEANLHNVYEKDGEIYKKIEHKGNEVFGYIGMEEELPIKKFFENVLNGKGKYEIATEDGYKPLGDLIIKKNLNCYKIKIEGNELKCSENHLLKVKDKGWVFCKDILLNEDEVLVNGFWKKVIEKEEIGIYDTYDFEVLTEEHSYLANGFVSHNTSKTSCIKQLAKTPIEYKGKKFDGIKVVDIPLAQIEEMGDLLGLPETFVEMEREIPDK